MYEEDMQKYECFCMITFWFEHYINNKIINMESDVFLSVNLQDMSWTLVSCLDLV